MPVIYEPKGRAREYAELACNLYRGCPHGCRYCYAPACLHMSREDFSHPEFRTDILARLRAEAPRYSGDPRRVLLCFSCDPYQPAEQRLGITRNALVIFKEWNVKANILTKNPMLALQDLDLLLECGTYFGVSLVWQSEARRIEWEPDAPSVGERMIALHNAHEAGLHTWVSLEPVIDPFEALGVIERNHPWVDVWKVGKLNYNRTVEAKVDWLGFRQDVTELLDGLGAKYYIKRDLAEYPEPGAIMNPRAK